MRSLLIQETVSDEKLPQAGALLNASHMREVFERELAALLGPAEIAAICRVESCRIVYTKYRPGKNFLITYLLEVVDHWTGQTGQRREQLMTLLACVKGESRELFANANKAPLVDTGFGDGVFHIPGLEAVVWVFPNDRKLTGLPALIDSDGLKSRFLPELVTGNFGDEWSIMGLESQPVHYVPERACTVRVKIDMRSAVNGGTASRVLFGKTYCSSEGEAAWQRLQTLWDSGARRAGRLLISQPLAYHPEIRTLWQSGLMGKTLNEVDANSRLFFELLENAGSAVAELHRTAVPSAPLITTGEIIAQLEMSAVLLSRILSGIGSKRRDELRSTIRRLIAVSDRIGTGSIATLHGDLHLKNLFVTDDRIALLDLDNLSRGDPLRDIGSFIAFLHYRGLIEGWSLDVAEDISKRFVQSYRTNVDWDVPEWALNWHIAAALIYERAYRCVTRLKVGRLDILDEIIALADVYSARI
jgi:Phosphotransferase enzyme family